MRHNGWNSIVSFLIKQQNVCFTAHYCSTMRFSIQFFPECRESISSSTLMFHHSSCFLYRIMAMLCTNRSLEDWTWVTSEKQLSTFLMPSLQPGFWWSNYFLAFAGALQTDIWWLHYSFLSSLSWQHLRLFFIKFPRKRHMEGNGSKRVIDWLVVLIDNWQAPTHTLPNFIYSSDIFISWLL